MDNAGELLARAAAEFARRFGGKASVAACAPGRVELLGNHTDYNGGLVMSVAIDRFTLAVAQRAPGRVGRVHSLNFEGAESFRINDLRPAGTGEWPNYVKGVVWAFEEAAGAPLADGFDMALAGDVPLGAGLSSSASLEAAAAMAMIQAGLVGGKLHEFGQGDWTDARRMTLAHLLRRAENAYVGVASGLLDQFSSLFGRVNQALFLDCLTLEYARVPLGAPAPSIVVCDSKTSRRLADGMYNRRRAECESVVAYFQRLRGDGSVRLLRDLSLEDLTEHWDRLDPVGRLRARHVLTENERVRQGATALRTGDLSGFGRLVSASHASSRADFENSSEALDDLIEAAEAAPGFLGGKLSGAGWAGCTVNLVQGDRSEDFAEAVRTAYSRKRNVLPEIHICKAADGAGGRTLTE